MNTRPFSCYRDKQWPTQNRLSPQPQRTPYPPQNPDPASGDSHRPPHSRGPGEAPLVWLPALPRGKANASAAHCHSAARSLSSGNGLGTEGSGEKLWNAAEGSGVELPPPAALPLPGPRPAPLLAPAEESQQRAAGTARPSSSGGRSRAVTGRSLRRHGPRFAVRRPWLAAAAAARGAAAGSGGEVPGRVAVGRRSLGAGVQHGRGCGARGTGGLVALAPGGACRSRGDG